MSSNMFLSVFAIYVLFLIAIGWWVSRRNRTTDDFLLSGRNLSIFLTLGTTVATMVGTGSSMGAVGFAYSNGWAGTLYGIGGALGILVLGKLFASARSDEFSTMSEEIAAYVGGQKFVKAMVAVLMMAASIGWLGAHIIGGGLYLAWIADIDPFMAKLIIAAGFSIYVITGGYSAVVWTDTLQAIILFIGFLLMAVLAVEEVGGLGAMLAHQPEANVSWFAVDKLGMIPAVSLAFVVFVGVLATPSYRQRIYSAKSEKAVRQSFYLAGGLYLVFSFVPPLIGMSAYSLNSGLAEANFAFPFLAIEVLPTAIGLIVLIAGLSATMSSASSDAIAAVSILSRDILHQNGTEAGGIKQSRIGLMVIIGVALACALLSNDIITYISKMIATVMTGLCVCGVLGRFWPVFSWQGAIASLLSASCTSLLVMWQTDWLTYWGNPVLPALVISGVAGVIVSLLRPDASA